MRTSADCISCFLDQARRAGRLSTDDEKKMEKLLDEVGMILKNLPSESRPLEIVMRIYKKVFEITGNRDPYRKIKDESTRKALKFYPLLKKRVESAVRLSGTHPLIRVALTIRVTISPPTKPTACPIRLSFMISPLLKFQ